MQSPTLLSQNCSQDISKTVCPSGVSAQGRIYFQAHSGCQKNSLSWQLYVWECFLLSGCQPQALRSSTVPCSVALFIGSSPHGCLILPEQLENVSLLSDKTDNHGSDTPSNLSYMVNYQGSGIQPPFPRCMGQKPVTCLQMVDCPGWDSLGFTPGCVCLKPLVCFHLFTYSLGLILASILFTCFGQ